MAGHDPEQHNIVVRLTCTWTFQKDLVIMLRREFDADVRSLIDPYVTKAFPEPLQDAMLLVSTTGSLLYLAESIRNQIREAQRKRDSDVGDDPAYMGYEREQLEDIDEFVKRLLEDEE